MRKLALWLVFLLTFAPASAVFADDEEESADTAAVEEEADFEDEDDDWDDFDFGDEEESGFAAYGSSVGNRYLIGINSFATFLADPVMSTAEPDEEFDELPGATVTKYPVGFFQGTLLGAYRATTGVLDVVLAPLTPFKMLSPEPRYLLFENAEHEEY
ncbi:MAG: hypothetical protein ACQGVC_21480 [Myxococcota bacterium]